MFGIKMALATLKTELSTLLSSVSRLQVKLLHLTSERLPAIDRRISGVEGLVDDACDLTRRGFVAVHDRADKLGQRVVAEEAVSRLFEKRLASVEAWQKGYTKAVFASATPADSAKTHSYVPGGGYAGSIPPLVKLDPLPSFMAADAPYTYAQGNVAEPSRLLKAELAWTSFPYGSRVRNEKTWEFYRRIAVRYFYPGKLAFMARVREMSFGIVIPRPAGCPDANATGHGLVYILCDDGKVRATRLAHLKVVRSRDDVAARLVSWV